MNFFMRSNGQLPVKLPPKLNRGDPSLVSWCNSARMALQQLRDRRPGPESKRIAHDTKPPFTVILIKDPDADPQVYKVVVTEGYICERDMALGVAEDALVLWDCPGRLDVDGNLTEFEIEEDEAIFVRVYETNDGNIGASGATEPVDLVVAAKTTKSLNYVPTGQLGVYYYKLAELVEVSVGEPLELVNYLAGSHIYKESGLTADWQLLDCYDGSGNTQLSRLSFLSGNLVSVDETTTARPLFDNAHEAIVSGCT